jgi:hypothetical protein
MRVLAEAGDDTWPERAPFGFAKERRNAGRHAGYRGRRQLAPSTWALRDAFITT